MVRNLFSKPTANCQSQAAEQPLPSEQVSACSTSPCAKSVNSSYSPTVGGDADTAASEEGTPAKRLKLELFESAPIAESTPLSCVRDRASPELFDSPHTNTDKKEAVDQVVNGRLGDK